MIIELGKETSPGVYPVRDYSEETCWEEESSLFPVAAIDMKVHNLHWGMADKIGKYKIKGDGPHYYCVVVADYEDGGAADGWARVAELIREAQPGYVDQLFS